MQAQPTATVRAGHSHAPPRDEWCLRCGMANRATPNLPARDLTATSAFYERLGFTQGYRDDGWMILERDDVVLEFFPFPDLDPSSSSFGCCLRLDDVQAFYDRCRDAGLPEITHGWPRLHPPRLEASGLVIGALIDPDGTLLRLVQNP
ncbi:bleomycin resistance protein [Pedococcus aerophilus]|uniref:Bleomycin resistance protein n=2 Tax=Pedococcus aerophilus TaxID=436356 RepID=A0ABP6HDQ2_9MICO